MILSLQLIAEMWSYVDKLILMYKTNSFFFTFATSILTWYVLWWLMLYYITFTLTIKKRTLFDLHKFFHDNVVGVLFLNFFFTILNFLCNEKCCNSNLGT